MWLLPSRGRPQKLKECLDSAVAMGMFTPGRVLIDESDPTKDEYLKLQLPKDWEFYIVPKSLEESIVCVGKSIRMWIKDNQTFCDNCTWIGLFSDDNKFASKDWDLMMLEECKGLRMICTNDRWRAIERMSGATMWTGDLFRIVGKWLYPSNFCHMYTDNVWEQIGINTGIWCVHMGVLVDHDHWTRKEGVEPDDTTKYAETFLLKDKASCTDYFNNELSNVVNRIRSVNMHTSYPNGIHLFVNSVPNTKKV